MDQLIASEPGQPATPTLSLDQPGRPPWRPRVSGISGFLCGPLAAAIITYINLRRLGERRRAFWTIALTVAVCAGFGLAITMVPDSVTTTLGKLIGNILSPFLFPLLQTHSFGEWEKRHPGATPDNGWRTSGWCILGLAAFLVIAIGSAVAVSSNREVRDIEIRYTMPENAKIGEAVLFTISIRNTYRVVSIEMEGRALKPGKFPLSLDVCVETAFTCSSYELGTITVE